MAEIGSTTQTPQECDTMTRNCRQRVFGRGLISPLLGAVALLSLISPLGAEIIKKRSYDYAYQLMAEPSNPRLIAMGAVGTAMADHGFSFYNPAQPFLYNRRYLSFEGGRMPDDMSKASMELGFMGKGWYLAAAALTNSVNDIIVSDERGYNPNITFSWQMSTAALDIGFYKNNFSVALCAYGLLERISSSASYGLSFSAGVAWQAIPGKLNLGAAGFYPNTMTWTTALLDTTEKLNDGFDVANRARVGAAWSDTLNSFAYTAALDIEYDHGLKQYIFPVGVELWLIDALALRMGKRFNHEMDHFNLGVGLRMHQLRVDGSMVFSSIDGKSDIKRMLALTYELPVAH
jgi:hypothetical protein